MRPAFSAAKNVGFQQQRRNVASNTTPMYSLFFKNNSRYIVFVMAAAVAAEAVYGSFTSALWNNINSGKVWECL